MRTAGILVLLALSAVAFGQTQSPGMYSDQNGALTELSPAAYSGMQSSNAIVKMSFFWTFRGSHSAVQVSTKRPQFRLVCAFTGGVPLLMLCGPMLKQPTDLIIVRLDEKSDHREARSTTGTMFGATSGFDPKKTTTATAVKRDDGSWEVSTTADLKPGEYLITTGMQPQGFDFGIKESK
jgi:hypothetical protein